VKIPITKKGYEQLREELDHLIKTERSKIITEIAEARAHGDLSENAEYHAAKERQGFIEGRIRELETKLASAQIIDTSNISSGKVVFGATVVLKDLRDESVKQYTLVGQDESDLKNGKISVQSPVGRALIHHTVGDTVEITTPAKQVEYEILEIRFE
jgi:transcription elongation factor GreA